MDKTIEQCVGWTENSPLNTGMKRKLGLLYKIERDMGEIKMEISE